MVEMSKRPRRSNQWVSNEEFHFLVLVASFLPLVLVFILDLVCCWATETVGYARSPSACPFIYSRSRVS